MTLRDELKAMEGRLSEKRRYLPTGKYPGAKPGRKPKGDHLPKIRQYVGRDGLTHQETADRIGLHRSRVTQLCRGYGIERASSIDRDLPAGRLRGHECDVRRDSPRKETAPPYLKSKE